MATFCRHVHNKLPGQPLPENGDNPQRPVYSFHNPHPMDLPLPTKDKPRFGKRLLLLVPLLCAAGGIYTLCRTVLSVELKPAEGSEGYRIKLSPTRNAKRDSIQRNLHVLIRSFSIDGNVARFQLADSGNFGISDGFKDNENIRVESGFTVSGAGAVFRATEYHGGTVFTVKQITADSMAISYTHTFSGYNGFGGQLVTEDTGEFTLRPFGNP